MLGWPPCPAEQQLETGQGVLSARCYNPVGSSAAAKFASISPDGMTTADSSGPGGLRYQPDENPPAALALGLGLQIAVLSVAAVILIPTVVMRTAGVSEAYLSWAVFASVAVSGAATMLQAIRAGRIGTGHMLVMGTSGAFIALCISAVEEGGPALLATLVVISSLMPFLLSARLSLFQRVLTPTVSGTVIMLIPVTVIPAVWGLLSAVPAGSSVFAAPLSSLAVVLFIVGVVWKASAALRLWAPVIGVVAGSVVAAFFGLFELGPRRWGFVDRHAGQ